jgi:glycosyltransferase involved in cell wall biosynthesis
MRIAFVTFEFPPYVLGGAGKYAAGLTRELAKLGHDVVVFAPQIASLSVEELNRYAVKLMPVRVREVFPFPAVQYWLGLPRQIAEAEKDAPFDIIHFNGSCYWFPTRKLSSAAHVMTVHHVAADVSEQCNPNWITRAKDIRGETNPIYLVIEKRGIESSNRIIAVSEYTKTRILERYSIQPQKIDRVYSATDFDKASFSVGALKHIKEELALPDAPVILFVGRVDDRRKGLDNLLNAFGDVLTSQRASLLVVGSGNQGGARRLAASLNISEDVFFAGKVDERSLRKCYGLCTIYVCPSRLEGFGFTLLEAFAAGKPVVATNVGAIPEIVGEKNGSLVEPGDTRAMSNAITYYLENSELAETIGRHNARDVRRRFDWTTSARATEQVYRSLLV